MGGRLLRKGEPASVSRMVLVLTRETSASDLLTRLPASDMTKALESALYVFFGMVQMSLTV
jgi:hypothetical protein